MSYTINLLPRRHDLEQRSREAFRRAALLAFTLGLSVAGVLHLYGRERLAVQQVLNHMLAREMGQLDARLQEAAALRAEIETWTELQASRVRPAGLLAGLPPLLPAGVYLKGLTLEAEWVTLRGVARAEQDLASFLRQLAAPRSGFQQADLVEYTGVLQAPNGAGQAGAETAPEAGSAVTSLRTTQFTVRARLSPPEVMVATAMTGSASASADRSAGAGAKSAPAPLSAPVSGRGARP
jgi:type IV pilus assembly protein PilN